MENYSTTVVGLDVHKESIAVAVLPPGSDRTTEQMKIENLPAAIEKMVRRVAMRGPVEFVYEAGPCGYGVHRQITALGHRCAIIAPGLTPVKPGDRVKNDRRDAEKLARYHRNRDLTEIRIPTREEEAARDLVRAREDVLSDRLRARHRLAKFLLRQGRVHRETKSWGVAHRLWVKSQRFEWQALEQTFQACVRAVEEVEARMADLDQQLQDLAQLPVYREPVRYLRCLKGIDTLSALTLVVEAQEFRRFGKARTFMGYTGLGVSEFTTGFKPRRGSITKAGNEHIRRILVEAAWGYARRNMLSDKVKKRREGCPPEILQIAKKAQDRLHRKFARMVSRGKPHQVAVVGVARELAGFVWSIAQHFPAAPAVN